MDVLLGFVFATFGVVVCLAAGLLLLLSPRSRQLAPYVFLVYPSAYFAGLFCFFFCGFLVEGIMERFSNSNLVDWIGVLFTFGVVVVGALAGAISGLAWANRLWWRFFAYPAQQAVRPQSPGWLGLTPFVGKIRAWFLYHWASPVGNQASHNGATVAAPEGRDKYQGTT
jgi:hypothetical protein